MNSSTPLHIVLITCHDLGRHLGCYGVETVRTPNLDALASTGVKFESAFCVAPQCSPSRASLATGRYPHSHGVMGLAHGRYAWDLAPEERHVAALLRTHGYESHLFGLQHVTTRDPQSLGFDYVHDQGFGRDVASQVSRFLGSPLPPKPLYIEVNLFEPHRPYDYGSVQSDESGGVVVPPYLPDEEASYGEMAALQGAIREADLAVGRIIAALEDAGISDTALVIFTPDHGIAMPRAKCTLYDPGIEIALLMRWPGYFEGGRVVSELVNNIDVLPTLLELVGVHVPEGVQGRSFLPLLREEPYFARDAVFAEKTFHSYYDPMRGMRTQRFKFIRNFEANFLVEVPGDVQRGYTFRSSVELYSAGGRPDTELYDLGVDPFEQHNLTGVPELAEIEQELDARLWSWMSETGDPLLQGPVVSPTFRRNLEHRRRVR